MDDPSPPRGRWSLLIGNVWFRTATRPSVHFSLLFLTLGGFVAGVAFWGGFNTAMEAANTESFCISCHEMRDNVYQELQGTIHWTNRSGVRATCPDCHTPHPWTLKVARKMQASKEVWAKLFGTIDTRRKFLDQRTLMAQREWARMTANNSAECRNCHSAQIDGFFQAAASGRGGASGPAADRGADLHRLPQGHRAPAAETAEDRRDRGLR
jgi:cytochrome c-type protein NapC